MNSAILENSSVIVHGSMIGSHRWQKTVENSHLFRFDIEAKSLTHLNTERHGVEYSHSRAAGYLKIGWRTNASHS